MIVFWNGDYTPIKQVAVSPEDRGFLFGDGVYEVVRIYGGKCYEFQAHEARLRRSAGAIGMDLRGFMGMRSIAERLIDLNPLPGGDGVFYYQISRGVAPRDHPFPGPDVALSHYGYVKPLPVPDPGSRESASAVILPDRRWMDCHIKSIALLGSVLAAQKAKEQGAQEAILHRDGWVTEGSHTNVFAVLDGVLHTHPANERILDGISRQVVLKLADDAGFSVEERPMRVEDLMSASEIFLTGTTVEIWPVAAIDGRALSSGEVGPMARKLQALFESRQDRLKS
ncbi:MAG: aminotransferase class IV [Verrucomicrobiota bacterium]|nr:aminotransferase class IV [Verrucomicrobiota bacterium]